MLTKVKLALLLTQLSDEQFFHLLFKVIKQTGRKTAMEYLFKLDDTLIMQQMIEQASTIIRETTDNDNNNNNTVNASQTNIYTIPDNVISVCASFMNQSDYNNILK